MSAASKIEWTNATWNPVRGCALVSPGCTNCYAMRVAHRFGGASGVGPFAGLTQASKGGPVWTGKVRLVPELLDWPRRRRKPLRIFVNSMSDLFHEDVPDEFIAAVWWTMTAAPHHTYQILTKRPARMHSWVSAHGSQSGWHSDCFTRITGREPPGERLQDPCSSKHIWLGVSVEDQARADERIPLLRDTPAAIRWVSIEPMLGPIDAHRYLHRWIQGNLDWVVAGGESGPGARPMQPNWVRSLRDQCAAASVPFFFKQWGEWAPEPTTRHPHRRVGKKRAGRHLDGRTHDNYPA